MGGTSGHPIGASGEILSSNEILNVSALTFFPNPASEYIIIQLEGNVVSTIEVYSLDGKMVKAMQVGATESQVQLSVNELPQGLYIVRAISGSDAFVSKMVKL